MFTGDVGVLIKFMLSFDDIIKQSLGSCGFHKVPSGVCRGAMNQTLWYEYLE